MLGLKRILNFLKEVLGSSLEKTLDGLNRREFESKKALLQLTEVPLVLFFII